MKVYEVTFHLDQHWYDQFNTWLEFADNVPGEICVVTSTNDVTAQYVNEYGKYVPFDCCVYCDKDKDLPYTNEDDEYVCKDCWDAMAEEKEETE